MTHHDGHQIYHDSIVQISERFLVPFLCDSFHSADSASGFFEQALGADAGAVCWIESLLSA